MQEKMNMLYKDNIVSQKFKTQCGRYVNNGTYAIYTNASCRNNRGGCAAVVCDKNGFKVYSMGYLKTTNNRMEIMAILEGLKKVPFNCNVIVLSDSQYVIDIINKKNNIYKNKDLWDKLLRKIDTFNSFEIKYIRTHSGNKNMGNTLANHFAYKALNEHLIHDKSYEARLPKRKPKNKKSKNNKKKKGN